MFLEAFHASLQQIGAELKSGVIFYEFLRPITIEDSLIFYFFFIFANYELLIMAIKGQRVSSNSAKRIWP